MTRSISIPAAGKAAIIFAVLMGFLGSVMTIRARDSRELLDVRLGLLASQAGRRLEQQLTSRVGVLEFFGLAMPSLKVDTFEQFAQWTGPIHAGVAGFFAINFVNPEGIIQWVQPIDANRPALGKNLLKRAELSPYLVAASKSRSPHLSHFIQLYQGPPGFVVYVPVFEGDALKGYINGVFHLEDFLHRLVVPSAGSYAIKIETPNFPNAKVYVVGGPPDGDAVGRFEANLYGQLVRVEVRPVAPQGVAQHVDLATTLIFIAVLLCAIVISCISYLLMRSQERLKDRLEKERFQGTLLNLLVHDILNPLLVIRYSVDAADKIADGSVRQQLVKTYYGIDQIHQVITRVRDMRAIELGKTKLSLEPVPINDIIRATLDAFEPRLKEKGILLDVEFSPENPSILVDRVIFQNNVLNNVLDNACKFAESGTRLRLTAVPRQGQVVIEIEDQGAGMDQSVVAALFDENVEVSRPGTRGEVGTGIGMLQIKAYTRFFGGRISIQSRPKAQFPTGHGTTVSLFLPLARGPLSE